MNTLLRSISVPLALLACMSAFAEEPDRTTTPAATATATATAAAPSATSATSPTAPAATTTTATTTTAATPKAAEPTKVPAGYKARTVDGETLFCRKSTPMGTRFPTEVCMTQAQFEDSERNRESMRNELQDRQKSYSINR